MRLPEKVMLRRYHALDYDWTPLSRNPCWLSIAAHHYSIYMKRNRFAWFRLLMLSSKILSADYKLHCVCDKSFADDLVSSRYCKCESNLCITIHWGFCGVPSICSSLVFWFEILRASPLLRWCPYFFAVFFPSSSMGSQRKHETSRSLNSLKFHGFARNHETWRNWRVPVSPELAQSTVAILAQGTTRGFAKAVPLFFEETAWAAATAFRFFKMESKRKNHEKCSRSPWKM